MTIKQLLEMPTGRDNRIGGFQLVIKTARKITEVGDKYLQGVVFLDDTGEIPAEVSLSKYIPLIRNQKIHITICWLQATTNGKKLYVEQWYPITITEPTGYTHVPDWGPEDSEALEWQAARREEIKGKCRHGVVCAYIRGYSSEKGLIPEISEARKMDINEWVNFILTGQ